KRRGEVYIVHDGDFFFKRTIYKPINKCGVRMKSKLSQLKEEDFAVSKGPIESGRQSPNSIAATLLLVPVMVLLLLGLANLFVFTDRSIPAHYIVIIICMIYNVIGIIILILSLIFSIK